MNTFFLLSALFALLATLHVMSDFYLRAFIVTSFTTILELYFGAIARSLAGSASVHVNTVVVVSIMTAAPIMIFALLRSQEPGLIVSRQDLAAYEYCRIRAWLHRNRYASYFLYGSTYAWTIIYYSAHGGLFRSLYTSAVKDHNNLLLAITQACGLLLAATFFMKRRYILWLLVVISLIVLGKKLPVFLAFLWPILIDFLYLRRRSINLVAPAILTVVGFWFLGTHLYYKNHYSVLTQVASSLDYLSNFDYFMQHYKLGSDGGEIFITSFYKYIPRIIWAGKPVVYGFLYIQSHLFPADLAAGYTPSTYEYYSVWLADFGYAGVLIFCANSALWLIICFYRRLTPMWRFALLLSYNDSTSAVLIGIFYICSAGLHKFLNRKRSLAVVYYGSIGL